MDYTETNKNALTESTQRWPGEAGGWSTLGPHYGQGQVNEWRNLEDRVD